MVCVVLQVYGKGETMDVDRMIDMLQALEKFVAVKDFNDGSAFKVNTYIHTYVHTLAHAYTSREDRWSHSHRCTIVVHVYVYLLCMYVCMYIYV